MVFDPVAIALLLVVGGLYVRGARALAARGRPLPRWQLASFGVGLGLVAVALLGPLDPLADDLLLAHMGQHILLADLAAPLLVAGLRTPMLQWFLPRPALVAVARRSGLRRLFASVRRPLPALALYVLSLYAWHLTATFTAALRHPFVHALQHESFLVFNALVWWVVLEPGRARMPGQLWKIGHIFAARMASMFLGVGLVFSKSAWYASYYGDAAARHGLTPRSDQQFAGGMMMVLDVALMFFALCLFFWRAAHDEDRQQTAAAGPARALAGPT